MLYLQSHSLEDAGLTLWLLKPVGLSLSLRPSASTVAMGGPLTSVSSVSASVLWV